MPWLKANKVKVLILCFTSYAVGVESELVCCYGSDWWLLGCGSGCSGLLSVLPGLPCRLELRTRLFLLSPRSCRPLSQIHFVLPPQREPISGGRGGSRALHRTGSAAVTRYQPKHNNIALLTLCFGDGSVCLYVSITLRVETYQNTLAEKRHTTTTAQETRPIIVWTVSITPHTESLCSTTDWQDQR